MTKTVTVKSGLNRVVLELEDGEDVEALYSRCKTALNLDESSTYRVAVDGETGDFEEVAEEGVVDGSVVEFVKKSGTKGN